MKRILLAGAVYMGLFAGWISLRYLTTGVPAFVFDATDAPVNGRVALLMLLYSVQHRWVVAVFEALWVGLLTRSRHLGMPIVVLLAAMPPAAWELWFVYRGSAALRPYFGAADFLLRAPLLLVMPAVAGAAAGYGAHRLRGGRATGV